MTAVHPPGTRFNTGFGTGIFRRRLRLISGAGEVRAGLEDTNHAMRLVLRHDGQRVTGIEPVMTRIPMSICAGAAVPLRAFAGLDLASYPTRPSAVVDARANCTHLHHLALLAMAHARRTGTRQYDVEIPDEHPDPVWSSVRCDGVVVHRWRTFDAQIVGPDAFAGLSLREGFGRWVTERFQDDELEAAYVLGNAYVVSFARRFDTEAWAGKQAVGHTRVAGRCFSYQPEVVSRGVYLADVARDTTDTDTPLLADFE